MGAISSSFGVDPRPEIIQLHETINKQIEESKSQAAVMKRLTWATLALAAIQVVTAGIQIWQNIK